MKPPLSESAARWRLAYFWLAGAGLVFLILVVQSLTGYYEPKTEQAWSWFLPTVMPTLSLIIGVLVADARKRRQALQDDEPAEPTPAHRPLYRLSGALSALYLLMVTVSILVQPLLASLPEPIKPLELMTRSNLWLGPLQGLTAAALAYFFTSGEG